MLSEWKGLSGSGRIQQPWRHVLVIDDDEDFAEGLGDLIGMSGFVSRVAHDSKQAMALLHDFDPAVALVDIRLGIDNGLDLVNRFKEIRPDMLSVLVTANADVESAMSAVRLGAYDYLRKPVHEDEIIAVLERAFETLRLRSVARAATDAAARDKGLLMEALTVMTDGLALFDEEDRLVLCNERFRAMYPALKDILKSGVSARRLLQRAVELQLLPAIIDDGQKRSPTEWHRFGRGPIVVPIETGRWARIDQTVTGRKWVVVVHTDISDLKRQEQMLRAEEARLEAIMANAADGIVTIDRAGTILSFSRAAEKMFGYAAADVVGKPVDILVPADDGTGHAGFVDRHLRGGEAKFIGAGPRELAALHKDGSVFPVEIALAKATVGEATIFIGSLRDISERKRYENQLRQVQRMEAVGKLTGGIAHDFNNLLTAIVANLQMLGPKLAHDPSGTRLVDIAFRAAERGSDLVRRLLAFSRQQNLSLSVVDVNPMVTDIVRLLEPTMGDGIELNSRLADDVSPVRVDKGQLENALINLVVNARDAAGLGGAITIETGNRKLDESYVARHDEVEAGDYVMIAVHDDGTGMTPEVVEKAFEPFFTTKDVGQGSGLGLSMVFGFVKQSGGHVDILSTPDKGSSVRMFLPVQSNSIASEP